MVPYISPLYFSFTIIILWIGISVESEQSTSFSFVGGIKVEGVKKINMKN